MENKTPFVVNLEPGTYYFCKCGKSNKLPLCDGSHQNTEFTPHIEVISEAKTIAICTCGNTSNGIHCDGSHKKNVEQ